MNVPPRSIGPMDLRQLRYFVGVVTAGSFGKAANTLNVAQPALSRQIKALEDDLGVQLLHRTSQGVQVTEAGERLHELADHLLRSAQNIKNEVVHLAREPAGDVVVGLPPSLAYLMTPNLIAECNRRYPKVSIRVIEALSVFLLDWVDLGRIDVALLTDPKDSSTLLRTELVLEDMVLVGAPTAFAPGKVTAELMDLTRHDIIISEGFRRVIQPWCEAANVDLDFAMQMDSIHIIQEMVRRGLYCTVVPYAMVHEDVLSGRLRALPFTDPHIRRRIVLAYSARRPLSLSMSAIGSLLQDITATLVTSAPTASSRPKA